MTITTPAGEELTFCTVHPDRETSLRCNKCERLMCTECAVLTPVGYRCRECVRGHQERFLKASRADDVIVFAVSAVVTGALVVLEKLLPIPIIFLLLLSIPAGGLVSELALRAVGRRRSRYIGLIAGAGAALGGLAGAFGYTFYLVNQALAGQPGALMRGSALELVFEATVRDWTSLLLIAILTGVVYARLRVKF